MKRLRRFLNNLQVKRMARAMAGRVRPSQTMVAVYTMEREYTVLRFANKYGFYRDVIADYDQVSRLIAALMASRREIMEHAVESRPIEMAAENPGSNETRH